MFRKLVISPALLALGIATLATPGHASNPPATSLYQYLTTDVGVTAASTGNTSLWADQSAALTGGTAQNSYQTNPNLQPQWSADSGVERNGHPVMIFGAPNGSSTPGPTFLFAAGTPANTTSAQLTLFIVAKNKNTTGGYGTLLSTGLANGWQLRFNGTGALEFVHNGVASPNKATLPTSTGWHIYELRQRRGTIVKLGVDGALGLPNADDGSPTTLTPIAASTTGVLTLGAQVDGSSPFQGQITQVLIYQGAQSAADRASTLNQLSGKYGITLQDPVPVEGSLTLTHKGKAVSSGAIFTAPVGRLNFHIPAVDDSQVTSVKFYNKGTLIGLGTGAGGTYTFSANNWPVGTYKITAIATDDLGTTSASSNSFDGDRQRQRAGPHQGGQRHHPGPGQRGRRRLYFHIEGESHLGPLQRGRWHRRSHLYLEHHRHSADRRHLQPRQAQRHECGAKDHRLFQGRGHL
ncbi:MAG: Ig-like domain-containing protein [Chthoniobacteraceae bacterium]